MTPAKTTTTTERGRPRGRRWPVALGALAVALGAVRAAGLSWTTDDAYISFRYAEHLVRGHGLVYNVGERVEGYSNFLWTVWCALGLRLGVAPETWTAFSGIACYALALWLLARFAFTRAAHAREGVEGAGGSHGDAAHLALPVAALAGAVHRDWAVFATGGLETSLFTLLVLAGFVLLAGRLAPRRAAGAGIVLGLAALTRPDGIMFVLMGAVAVVLQGRGRARATLAYGLAAAALLVPYGLWKLAYYGDLLPNTYYAKSATETWYTQGWTYAGLYFRAYWILLAGPLLVVLGFARTRWRRDARPDDGWGRTVALAAGFALAYTWAVIRVGGDFMFARFLIPVTPFYLLLIQLGLERAGLRRAFHFAAGAAAIVAVGLARPPIPEDGTVKGIADEWAFYHTDREREMRARGETLRRFFDGVPVRAAFVGGQAVLAYRSQAQVAIETATGLTDAHIARQPLARRGRVGHEKGTPVMYMLEQRRAHLWMFYGSMFADTLSRYIPVVPMQLGDLRVTVLRWEPAVIETLRARGAEVPDFPATLDTYIGTRLPTAPDEEVAAVHARARRFYFDGVDDRAREAPFLERLGLPSAVDR